MEDDEQLDPLPDEEDMFLESVGMGADGTPMTLADTSIVSGLPWEPDGPNGEW